MTGGLDTTPLVSAFHMCSLCKVVLVMGVDFRNRFDIPLKVVEKKTEKTLMMELEKYNQPLFCYKQQT